MPVMLSEPYSDIFPSSGSGWTQVDLTSNFGGDAGSVAGVYLQVYNPSGSTEYVFGVRKNSSTDTFTGTLDNPGLYSFCIGVDSNDILEIYVDTAGAVEVYLIGYFLNSEAVFPDNATQLSVNAGSYGDIDVSAITGADTALAIFTILEISGASQIFGYRQNGATIDPDGYVVNGDIGSGFCVVDGNEIFEGKSTTGITHHMVGYLTANVTDDGTYSQTTLSATGVWETETLPAAANSSAVMMWINKDGAGTSERTTFGFRDVGGSHSVVDNLINFHWAIVPIDGSDQADLQMSDNAFGYRVFASLQDSSGGGGGGSVVPIISNLTSPQSGGMAL